MLSLIKMSHDNPYELPYEGEKKIPLVNEVDSKEYLTVCFELCVINDQIQNQKRGDRDMKKNSLCFCHF